MGLAAAWHLNFFQPFSYSSHKLKLVSKAVVVTTGMMSLYCYVVKSQWSLVTKYIPNPLRCPSHHRRNWMGWLNEHTHDWFRSYLSHHNRFLKQIKTLNLFASLADKSSLDNGQLGHTGQSTKIGCTGWGMMYAGQLLSAMWTQSSGPRETQTWSSRGWNRPRDTHPCLMSQLRDGGWPLIITLRYNRYNSWCWETAEILIVVQ